tara:strand:+ start:300 stop:920 length:621 start_codon:yes stop_codon:yes gene_type:complete
LDFKLALITVSILIASSIFIRILLQLVGQKWITTFAHTTTLVLLPIITYIITSVISGNIALSLGMVGALSIVRFRNPVRSPLELSVYFGAITMGISASVDIKWLLFFVIILSLASIILIFINLISLFFFKRPFFTSSFSEGNSLSTLEIKTTEEIKILDESNLLSLKRVTDNEIVYLMVSSNFATLKNLQTEIGNDKKILNYQLNR